MRRKRYFIYRGWTKAQIVHPANLLDGPLYYRDDAEMYFRWRVSERQSEIESGLIRVAMVIR